MRGNWYQISLIFLGVLVSLLFGAFFLRELFPEYRNYQNIYVELEKFRSNYTGEPPPRFEPGIKQIVLERGTAPPVIDRCISCHVALQFEHFSPTRVAKDINGNIQLDAQGIPVKEPNPDDVWRKLDEKIAILNSEGNTKEAGRLKAFKTLEVDGHIYDVTKALRAHPLMGREMRPFQYHPVEEYGCTVCHSGNGRGLTTQKAHGPVFDGQYEEEFTGFEPQFLESDPANDPLFASVFNHKPGHRLLFQTEPLFPGALIEANCVQCHFSSEKVLGGAIQDASLISKRKEAQAKAVAEGYENEKEALVALVELRGLITEKGYQETLQYLRKGAVDLSLPDEEIRAFNTRLDYIQRAADGRTQDPAASIIAAIDFDLIRILGTSELKSALIGEAQKGNPRNRVEEFLKVHASKESLSGTLFAKELAAKKINQSLETVQEAVQSVEKTIEGSIVQQAAPSEIDLLISNFHRGQELFISQACYACHRIDGLFRGGVGPDLTNEGNAYPWFIKESIVWPQADLKTSTMPNFKMDHEEVEDLVTYLLAQHGRSQAVSETDYKKALLEWEAGAKLPWEQPISPGKLRDLRFGMTVFATEGCAACHRLKGFESDVGLSTEKKGNAMALDQERRWFRNLIPENSLGSEIVQAIETHAAEIDARILDDVRQGSVLEEIESSRPGVLASFYSPFKYALRAKDSYFENLVQTSANPEERQKALNGLADWKRRVHRVLMVYIQEYGLGRLVGPRPNWSGIYRSDEWLIEHFRKPTRLIPKSIMPILPFDDSKFYALTYMLNMLGKKNRDELRATWDLYGFDPQQAYDRLCAQCHGDFLQGNGPVAEWIYPIPKNLHNAEFLRNLTKENAIYSLVHGVKGTPMPPWGETPADKPFENTLPILTASEIEQLVNWLFSSLPGGTGRREADVPKWQYTPEDVIEELRREGGSIQPEREDASSAVFQRYNPESILVSLKPAGGAGNEIFEVRPDPAGDPNKPAYYIKKQYYTPENLSKGQQFFEMNCAVCHGKDGDGQSLRAAAMQDAKPRMLTNLNWIHMRDDLRLLRSIKYGIAGTSMTPWGDLTSSEQRLQLVMYIRSLVFKQEQREELSKEIYRIFDQADQALEAARIRHNEMLEKLRLERDSLQMRRQEIAASEGNAWNAIAEEYRKELELQAEMAREEQADDHLKRLKQLVEQEALIYQNMGFSLGTPSEFQEEYRQYLAMLRQLQPAYGLKQGVLEMTIIDRQQPDQEIDGIVREIEAAWNAYEKEKTLLKGKLPSLEQKKQLEVKETEIGNARKVLKSLKQGQREAKTLRAEQLQTYKKYTELLKK